MTRLTNAFSKKLENHNFSIGIQFMYYNFCRVHRTLRVTPAMEAGVTDDVLEVDKIIGFVKESGMKNAIAGLALISLVVCSGCGTIVTHVPGIDDPEVPQTGIYRGVRYDAFMLGHYGGPYSPVNLVFPDLAVSAISDTLMLPYDLKKENDRAKEDGQPKYPK